MLAVTQFIVVRQRMTQISVNRLIDLCCGSTAFRNQLLEHLQLFSRRQACVQLDAGAGSQLEDAVLRKILYATADIIGSFVFHSFGIGVHGHKCQFIQPAGDVALFIYIAHGLADAHGDAQYLILTQAHSTCQSGNITAVGNHQRNIGAKGVRGQC